MQRATRSLFDYKKTLLRNLLTSLLLYEAIQTTSAKAKLLVPFANRFYNRVKAQDLAARRLAYRVLFDKMAVRKLFEEILPRYQKRETTFVSVLKLSPRFGDRAGQSLVSLIHQLNVGDQADSKVASDNVDKVVPNEVETKPDGAEDVKKAKPRARR